jgi:hypothetical protein
MHLSSKPYQACWSSLHRLYYSWFCDESKERNNNRCNDRYVMINPLHLKSVLKPMHSYIERTRDWGRKYAVTHIKNITRQVGLNQYSANAVTYKVIILFNDKMQSIERDIGAWKMTFFYSFHSLYHICISQSDTISIHFIQLIPLLVILDFQTIILFLPLIAASILRVMESHSIVGVIFATR